MYMLKEKILKYRNNQNAKTIVSNFIWLSIVQVAGFVFPLLTMPYLARVIGASGMGKVAFASAVMLWVQTLVDWGFNYTATRDVAKNRDNIQRVSEIFSTVFWARCILMIAALLALILLTIFVPIFRENTEVIFFTFLMIPGHILFPEWFFQAMERMKYISILNVLSKLLFTIAVFVFIKDKEDYTLQPLFISLGFLLSGFIALYYIFFKWEVKLLHPSFSNIRKVLSESSHLFINTLMPNLYNSFSVILLGVFSTPYMNGIYDAGKKLSTIAAHLLQIISRACFPFLVRNPHKHHLFAKIVLTITTLIIVIIFLFAPTLIDLFFGEGFGDAIIVLRITSIAMLFVMLSNVYGANYLIVVKKDKLLRNITMTASIIGFVTAFPLVYYWNYLGASLTYLISSMLLGTLVFYFAKKDQRPNNKNTFSTKQTE